MTKDYKSKAQRLFATVLGIMMIFNCAIIPVQAKTDLEISNNAIVSTSGIRNPLPVASGVKDVVADGEITGWTAVLDDASIYGPVASEYATSQAEEAVAVIKITLPAGVSGKSGLSVSLWSPEIKADSRLNTYRYLNGKWEKVKSTVRLEHIDLDMTGMADAIVLITKCPSFRYVHNPAANKKVLNDAIVNPDAVYGFSPNPESTRLKEYVDALDWTDPVAVAKAKKDREDYHAKNAELYSMIEKLRAEGKDIEAIARAVSRRRNELRFESYVNDPEGLARLKKSNFDTYGNEEGPTIETLYEKYGSWQTVLEKALSSNVGMDACLGLYDEYYDINTLSE